MPIIKRFAHLCRADIHAVLDQLEDPVSITRQAIRDMVESLETQTARQAEREQQLRDTHARLAEVETARQALASALDLCFASDDMRLARLQLRRQLEQDRLHAQLLKQIDRLSALIHEAAEALVEQRQRLAVLQEKADILLAPGNNHEPGTVTGLAVEESSAVITEADIDLAMLREQQRRAQGGA